MVLIAVPNTGTLRTALVEKLFDFGRRDGVELYFNQARPVDVNRVEIAQHFMEETDHDYLLMVDSDVIPPDNVLEIMDYDVDVVTPVLFSTKEGNPYPIAVEMGEDGKLSHIPGGDLDELEYVDGLGTGCMFIKREVFEGMDEPWFSYDKNPDGTMNVGEDFDFCMRANEAGFDVAVATEYTAGHIAEVNLENMMRLMGMALEEDADDIFVDSVGKSNETSG